MYNDFVCYNCKCDLHDYYPSDHWHGEPVWCPECWKADVTLEPHDMRAQINAEKAKLGNWRPLDPDWVQEDNSIHEAERLVRERYGIQHGLPDPKKFYGDVHTPKQEVQKRSGVDKFKEELDRPRDVDL